MRRAAADAGRDSHRLQPCPSTPWRLACRTSRWCRPPHCTKGTSADVCAAAADRPAVSPQPNTIMSSDSCVHLSVHSTLSEEDRASIERGLMDHARTLGIDATEQERIAVCLRTSTGLLAGGLIGGMMWGWLEVRLLWVHRAFRSKGHGATLLDTAEREAARRGCHHARLETYDREARRFYQRRGYAEYGFVPDYPIGHTRWLLMKPLPRPDAAG